MVYFSQSHMERLHDGSHVLAWFNVKFDINFRDLNNTSRLLWAVSVIFLGHMVMIQYQTSLLLGV